MGKKAAYNVSSSQVTNDVGIPLCNVVTKLKLILWKQLMLRKSRLILSSLEFASIVLMFFLCQYGCSVITKERDNVAIASNKTNFSTNELHEGGQWQFANVYYMPDNDRVKKIINNAVRSIGKDLLLEGLADEDQMEVMIKNQSQNLGIVFSETPLYNKNECITYKLRTYQSWIPSINFYDIYNGPLLPKNYMGSWFDLYEYKYYYKIQYEINKSLMPMIDKELEHELDKLTIQRFPHHTYSEIFIPETSLALVQEFIEYAILFPLLILSICLITDIIDERENGVKEYIKISGMQEWIIWVGWILYFMISLILILSIFVVILKYEFMGPNTAIFRYTNASILWCHLMLYLVANIAFCFVFSTIFHKGTIAASMFMLIYFMAMIFSKYKSQLEDVNGIAHICFMILKNIPVVAFDEGFNQIKYCEIHGIHLNWGNLELSNGVSDPSSLNSCFVTLIFDAIFYFFLSYYIGAINPGKYGVAKSPFFIFKFFFGDLFDGNAMDHKDRYNIADKFFQSPPPDAKVSIEIRNLYKYFNSKPSVNGVDLKIYDGEILVLLGHNGAGKTTILNILTGVTKPSYGSIKYGQYRHIDVLNNAYRFRQKLGFCPQENRLLSYISVQDHLWFFGMLKGRSRTEVLNEAAEYMENMEISDKANSKVSILSGGMKRKLCLAISLMGKTKILILDEPTSGLDIQSRRKVWDILHGLRGDRTIILTTHHMEEADTLGDRITILHQGVLCCWGTSMFLKKCYDTGYKVTITKAPSASFKRIDQLMLWNGNQVNIEKKSSICDSERVYLLPFTKTNEFPTLFEQIEKHAHHFGITNISITYTTLEQVFLKAAEISINKSTTEKKISIMNSEDINSNYYNSRTDLEESVKDGLPLYLQQIIVLIWKKWLYTKRNYWMFFWKVIAPTVFVWIALIYAQHKKTESPNVFDHITLSMDMYKGKTVMIRKSSPTAMFDTISHEFGQYLSSKHNMEIMTIENDSIGDGLKNLAQRDMQKYLNDVMFAVDLSTNHSLFFNKRAIHGEPVLINTFTNFMLFRHKIPTEITIINHPVITKTDMEDYKKSQVDKSTKYLIPFAAWFSLLVYISLDLGAYFTVELVTERTSHFKHIQLMSNLTSLVYVISNFVYDFAFFSAILIIRILGVNIIGSVGQFKFDIHLGVLTLILVLYVISTLIFSYVLNYWMNTKSNLFTVVLIINIVGSIMAVYYYFMTVPNINLAILPENKTGCWSFMVECALLLIPFMNYVVLFIKFFSNWLIVTIDNKPGSFYFTFVSNENPNGLLKELIFIVCDILIYSALLVGIQSQYFENFWHTILKNAVDTQMSEVDDQNADVIQEGTMVDCAMKKKNYSNCEISLISSHLKKKCYKYSWSRPFIKPFTAVHDVTFQVKSGECFGLLGVNGAGKSTTFKMLTAETASTSGDSWINGHWLNKNKISYLAKIGYCPQMDSFMCELTGRELLTIIAKLRGIRANKVTQMVYKWLKILDLEKFQDQKCENYSGGNKRKICTAMSLIGDPQVVFLDEPTSGVDPESRKKLHDIITQSKQSSGQTVVLTSHSMDECEHLCDKLTILVKGKMKCIGQIQYLKKQYAQGFSIIMKLFNGVQNDALSKLKEKMNVSFKCNLKDERKTQLYYLIVDTQLKWSTIFRIMEGIKDNHSDSLEDYIVADTSIEEVFMGFAKNSFRHDRHIKVEDI